jgi:hypothetical protein
MVTTKITVFWDVTLCCMTGPVPILLIQQDLAC